MQHPLFVESVHALLCMFEFLHSILECYWYTDGTERLRHASGLRGRLTHRAAYFALLTRTLVAYRFAALDPSPAEQPACSFPRLLECRLPESFRSNCASDITSKVYHSKNIQVLIFTQQLFCPLGSECFEIRSEYFFE